MSETTYDRVKALCRQKGVSIARMERDLGFQRSAAHKWVTREPSMPAVLKMVDYFDVPVAAVLGGGIIKPIDVNDKLLDLIDTVNNAESVEYSGMKLDSAERKLITSSLQQTLSLCDITFK